MIRRLKCEKGVTLIELVVAMLMFTVVASIASLIMSSVMRMYIRANELAECGAIFDNIANQMIDDMSHTTNRIKISDSGHKISFPVYPNSAEEPEDSEDTGNADGRVIYTVNDGYLEKNGAPVFHVDFYRSKRVDFICKETGGADEAAYTLTIIALSSGDIELARRDYAVRPLVPNYY